MRVRYGIRRGNPAGDLVAKNAITKKPVVITRSDTLPIDWDQR